MNYNISYELFIALRYIWGKRKRDFITFISIISVLGVALGVMTLIIVLAVMSGFQKDIKEKMLGTNAHIIVMKFGGAIDDYQDVMEKISNIKDVIGISPYIMGEGMVSSEMGVSGVVINGVIAESASRVLKIGDVTKEGSFFALDENPDGVSIPIIIGKELSKNLGVFYEDEVTLISPFGRMTPLGFVPRAKKFIVKGIFDTGMYEYDSSFVYIPLKYAQKFFELGDTVTGIQIKVRDVEKSDKVASKIQALLSFPYYTRDWRDMNRNLFSALKLEKTVMFLLLTLIIFVAAFNIIVTLIMVVMDKIKDIAILITMGATRKNIMRIFFFQGAIIGVIGTIIGIVSGYTVCILLSKYKFIHLPSDIYYISTLPVNINILDFVFIALSALFITFVATLYPAFRASKITPAEALRYE